MQQPRVKQVNQGKQANQAEQVMEGVTLSGHSEQPKQASAKVALSQVRECVLLERLAADRQEAGA